MKRGETILNISENVTYIVDEVYTVDNFTVVFTEDSKCFPICQLRTGVKLKPTLIKKIATSMISEKTSQNIRYQINKELTYEKINPTTDSNTRTSWLRKIVSHLSKLGRRVRD